MQGIENIIAKINADAKAAALDTLSAAHREASEIAERYNQKIADLQSEAAKKSEEASKDEASRKVSAANLERRKLLLAAKQGALSEAFAKAEESLRKMNDDDFLKLFTRLIGENAFEGGQEIILSKQRLASVGEKLLSQVNVLVQKNGGAALTLSGEIREIDGVVLKSGRVESDLTFKNLIAGQKNALTTEVAKVLFEG